MTQNKSARQDNKTTPSQQHELSSADSKQGLLAAVEIINKEIALIQTTAKNGRLTYEDRMALGAYSRMLCNISSEERRQALMTTDNLGAITDEDLERLAQEAQETLKRGKK